MAGEEDDPAGSGERVAKRLARAGVCSRREAEELIAAGRVAVDGRVLDSPGVTVGEGSVVTVDDRPIPEPEPPRVWRFHKPKGVLTASRDPHGRKTIYDHLPGDLPRVMPIGRLDLASEGLLLLTNDGELKRRLELPQTGWLRRYRVRVHGRVDEAALASLARGVEIDGVRYGPILARLDRQQGANAWITVSLREGKNREIRRVVEHLGWQVGRLIRVAYGPFQLGSLERGAVEEVPARILRDQLGADTVPAGGRPGRGARLHLRDPAAAEAAADRPVPRREPAAAADRPPRRRDDGGRPAPRREGGGEPGHGEGRYRDRPRQRGGPRDRSGPPHQNRGERGGPRAGASEPRGMRDDRPGWRRTPRDEADDRQRGRAPAGRRGRTEREQGGGGDDRRRADTRGPRPPRRDADLADRPRTDQRERRPSRRPEGGHSAGGRPAGERREDASVDERERGQQPRPRKTGTKSGGGSARSGSAGRGRALGDERERRQPRRDRDERPRRDGPRAGGGGGRPPRGRPRRDGR
jgi:23S rRNA pseudouridine2605 synthase